MPTPCDSCPVAAGQRCPSSDNPRICELVRREAEQPARWGDYWTRKLGAARPMAERPGIAEMAANLARSVVAHVADGGRIAPPEVQAQRKAECLACPLHDAAAGRCLKCGCSAMNVKRSWASSACPDDPPRWTAV